ncbi:hypothetical protein GCM10010228_00590 [Streptomyces massasporeus]|nr:hypothetical protein GCM10010228_00590 [Streptomyces massasporeus]
MTDMATLPHQGPEVLTTDREQTDSVDVSHTAVKGAEGFFCLMDDFDPIYAVPPAGKAAPGLPVHAGRLRTTLELN